MRVLRLACPALWALSVATAPGADASLRVTATRSVQLVVVDTHAKEFVRDDLSESVMTALRAALQRRLGDDVTVRSERLAAQNAAARLLAARCDAVLVLGAERPRPLQRREAPTLAMHFGAEGNYEPVYLVLADGDPRLQALLTECFPKAVRAIAPRGEVIAVR